MAQVNIRMDDEMKLQAEAVFGALGLTMTTAITAFIAQSIRESRIPFELSLAPNTKAWDEMDTKRWDEMDTTYWDNMFYSERNMARLREIIQEIDSGKAEMFTKSWDELDAFANE